jgi:hypothetical protein
MTREELNSLFVEYLERRMTTQDWRAHGHKSYRDFELEISTCNEYLEYNKKVSEGIKIAFLISGHIRKNDILKGLEDFCYDMDYDVFLHTWDDIGIKGSETNLDSEVEYDKVLTQINRIPNVRGFEIENNKSYINSLPDIKGYFNFSSPEKFIKSQLYSINKSYNLMENYSKQNNVKYDIVFKVRFDCSIIQFSPTQTVVDNINKYDIIFTPNNKDSKHSHSDYGTSCWACDNMYYKHGLKHVHVFEHTNIVCDLFAYGSMSSMKKYCNLHHEYDNLIKSFNELNYKSLQKFKSHVRKVNGDYKFVGDRGHSDTLYYYNASYPERLLQKYLTDYMLVESKKIKMSLKR